MEFTKELSVRLQSIPPVQFSRYMEHGFMHPRIKPAAPGMKVAGPAWTVRATERDGSALYYAVMQAPKGSVIVVDRGREDLFAIADDQLARMMQRRELGGLVVDGPAAGRTGLEALGFPVFCTGFSPAAALCKGTNGSVQIPIQCGGAVVCPGDMILGDADGVIVLSPAQLTEELLQKAEAAAEQDALRTAKAAEGGDRFLQREDVDMVKFFEFDKNALISRIKKECSYTDQ